jgi:hypothetical protein
MTHGDLLGGPAPTLLPEDPATALLGAGQDPAAVAAAHPTSSAAWAALAAAALDAGSSTGAAVQAYAYARTGYHRGLDALRKNGWKGYGPVPWSHVPNQGVLLSFFLLGKAAGLIGEVVEVDRLEALLDESDPGARAQLT